MLPLTGKRMAVNWEIDVKIAFHFFKAALSRPLPAGATVIMPDTELGQHAVAGYSRYLGISAADLIQSTASPPTASDVATAVVELSTKPEQSRGKVFVVSGKGLEAALA